MYIDFAWIKIGVRPGAWTLELPPCQADSAVMDSEYFVDGGRNVDGVYRGTEVGRTIDKQQIKFGVLEPKKWWEIQNWFEENGKTFYAEIFNYRLGKKMVRKFYLGNVSQTPLNVDKKTGIPSKMINCVMNIIDVGE